jgi:hypothetical protein
VGPKGDKGDPGTTTWAGITDKPAVIAAGADALAARTAIGAADAAQIGVAGGMAALDGGGKVPIGQLPNSIMEYKGVWNAATNTPPLADGTGDPGDVHRVIVAGTHDFGAGAIKFAVGDYVVYSGTVWEKSGTTDSVPSVAGKTGDVVLVKADVGLANVDDTADAAKAVLSATKLATPRSINGVSFDGSADVTIPGLVSGSVNGTATALTLWTGTKAQYDAIVTKDASTVYAVTA